MFAQTLPRCTSCNHLPTILRWSHHEIGDAGIGPQKMALTGSAETDDGTVLYPPELATRRAKCDRRVLQDQVEAVHGGEALARAHPGSGPKPKQGYPAAEVERIRRDWFEKHDAIDPDEVTGVVGSSRAEALAAIDAAIQMHLSIADYLEATHHSVASIVASGRALSRSVGLDPPEVSP